VAVPKEVVAVTGCGGMGIAVSRRLGGGTQLVRPGIISTPMGHDEPAGPHGDAMRQMTATAPCRRYGTADDIAAAVEFLVSPSASFITGTDLLVDGGVVAALHHGDAITGIPDSIDV
jgi:Enoyl-(Acyl carrier protein) reductase